MQFADRRPTRSARAFLDGVRSASLEPPNLRNR
jgi:hypothetical protein